MFIQPPAYLSHAYYVLRHWRTMGALGAQAKKLRWDICHNLMTAEQCTYYRVVFI